MPRSVPSRVLDEYTSIGDPPTPLGAALGERRVVGGEDERAGVGGERLLEPLDRRQVEVVGGLVQDEQPGAAREAQRERELARLARRGLLGREQAARLDAERGDQREQTAALLGAERARLVQKPPLFGALELLRQDEQALRRDARAALERAQERRLARAVGAGQPDARSARDREVHVLDEHARPGGERTLLDDREQRRARGLPVDEERAADLLLELDLAELRAGALQHRVGARDLVADLVHRGAAAVHLETAARVAVVDALHVLAGAHLRARVGLVVAAVGDALRQRALARAQRAPARAQLALGREPALACGGVAAAVRAGAAVRHPHGLAAERVEERAVVRDEHPHAR